MHASFLRVTLSKRELSLTIDESTVGTSFTCLVYHRNSSFNRTISMMSNVCKSMTILPVMTGVLLRRTHYFSERLRVNDYPH